jgi:biotin carboxyl carrier protein
MKHIENKDPDCGDMKCKTLIIQGEKYQTRLTKKFENRKKWQKPDERKIFSLIPGTVVDIFAIPGAMVEKDGKMFVLEAMKMQNTYYYPFSGKIKDIYVKKGDRVCKGLLMLEFE